MKVIESITTAFAALVLVTVVGLPGLAVPALFVGGVIGYCGEAARQATRRREQALNAAAQQERQARLIASAIAERNIRQELGEF